MRSFPGGHSITLPNSLKLQAGLAAEEPGGSGMHNRSSIVKEAGIELKTVKKLSDDIKPESIEELLKKNISGAAIMYRFGKISRNGSKKPLVQRGSVECRQTMPCTLEAPVACNRS